MNGSLPSGCYASLNHTHLGERDNGQEIEREDPDGRPVQLLREDAEGHKDQEDIEPRRGQEPVEGGEEGGFSMLVSLQAAAAVAL